MIPLAVGASILAALLVTSRFLEWRFLRAYPPQGQFLTVDGVRLHIVEKGEGPPVVILHGSAGMLNGFAFYLLDTVAQRYHTILVDRPSFGASEPMPSLATIEVQNRLFHSLFQQLGVQGPVLLGHSWSATLAAGYALQFPAETSGLVLTGPGAFLRPVAAFGVIYRLIRMPLFGPCLLRLFHLLGLCIIDRRLVPLFYPAAVLADFRGFARTFWIRPKALRQMVVDWAPQTFGPAARAIQRAYGQICVPVVMLCGRHDRISPLDRNGALLHRLLPHWELAILEDAGHQGCITHPDAVLQAIDRAWELSRERHAASD